MNIILGKTYREVITGFKGVATARVTYLTGCDQVALHPGLDKDGKILDAVYFDHIRLELIDAPIVVLPGAAVSTALGGPNRDAPGISA